MTRAAAAVVLLACASHAQPSFFTTRLEAHAAQPPVVLDGAFLDTFEGLGRPSPCPGVDEAKRALSSPDAGTLAGLRAGTFLQGPDGSGRYVAVTLAVETDAGVIGACLHDSTIGHRTAHQVQEHFGAWRPLDADRFIMWGSISVDAEGDFGDVLLPRVYTLENGALLIDRRATAREVARFGAAYATCKGPGCRELSFASKEFAAWAKKVDAEPRPVALTVPDALRAVTVPLELSGLRWFAPLERYVAVSDDTGLEGNKRKGAPYLFTVSAAGVVDEQPVVLAGIERVDDLESITLGAPGSGELFAVTSHSLTKKGKARPERRQLLRIVRSETGVFTVTDSVDLEALGLRKLAGAQLDVEALAWRDGALVLGLKAPLDAKGRAQLFSLDWGKKTLAPWAAFTLAVNGIKHGVTDLLFLPDGRALLLSNQPKQADMTDFGGALWRLDATGAQPVLVQHFPGLKPEGLSPTPDGKRLKLVFDRGPGTPWWLEVPLP